MSNKTKLELALLEIGGRLNGYTVVERKAHENCVTVMVLRKDDSEVPYVVATWWPDLGKTWSWGHYCHNIKEADTAFAEAAVRNERR